MTLNKYKNNNGRIPFYYFSGDGKH